MIDVISLLSALLIAGTCAGSSATAAVNAQSTDGSETFSSKATGYLDGSGKLEIRNSRGRVCEGTFVCISHRDGEGTFTCNDSASGPFRFVFTGTKGTGSGNLNGRQFTFTFAMSRDS